MERIESFYIGTKVLSKKIDKKVIERKRSFLWWASVTIVTSQKYYITVAHYLHSEISGTMVLELNNEEYNQIEIGDDVSVNIDAKVRFYCLHSSKKGNETINEERGEV